MIPSSKWFPTSLQDRAAWFESFATNFEVVAVSLGFVAADSTAVKHDADMMTFIAATTVTVDSYVEAIRAFKKTLTEGAIGEPTPGFPGDLALTIPTSVPTGIFERLDNLVKRIRFSPNYTPEIGALLGIIPGKSSGDGSGGISTDTAPVITAGSQPGNQVLVKFVRGSNDGIYIECQIDNAGTWETYGRFLKSPATLDIPINSNHLPRNVEIRARFLDGNNPVGDWSDVVTVQTIP